MSGINLVSVLGSADLPLDAGTWRRWVAAAGADAVLAAGVFAGGGTSLGLCMGFTVCADAAAANINTATSMARVSLGFMIHHPALQSR